MRRPTCGEQKIVEREERIHSRLTLFAMRTSNTPFVMTPLLS